MASDKKLTKTELKYINLLEDVDAQESLVKMYQGYLDEQKKFLAEAQQKVRDFESKHVGEQLLKPYTIPAPSYGTISVTLSGSGYGPSQVITGFGTYNNDLAK